MSSVASTPASTPAQALAGELRRDPGRPLVTFYDDATGERVELSVATFDNWVAKTAGFLQDGLSAQPGDRVTLLLPPHWQSLVWAAACWAVGTCVATGDAPAGDAPTGDDPSSTVAVAGPDALDAAEQSGAGDIVGLALRPLGGRFTEPLPAHVLDYAVEVPSWPDRFAPYAPPAPADLALAAGGTVATQSGVLERAREHAESAGLAEGARVLVSTTDLHAALIDALLVPLVVGGSAVLVRHEDPATRDARLSAERVTAVMS